MGFVPVFFFSQAEITPGPKKGHRFVLRRQDTTRKAPQRAQAAACSGFMLPNTFSLDHVTLNDICTFVVRCVWYRMCIIIIIISISGEHPYPLPKKVSILLKDSNILIYPIISKPGEHHHQHSYLCVCISYPTPGARTRRLKAKSCGAGLKAGEFMANQVPQNIQKQRLNNKAFLRDSGGS